MDLTRELERLRALRVSGALTEEEFARAKAQLLARDTPRADGAAPPRALEGADLERQTRDWALWLHLSLLAGVLVPLADLVAPIVIWQVKKEQLPGLDVHGRNAVNWILSSLIYLVAGIALAFVVVGIPLLIALAVVSIVFPILAGLKASAGEVWTYPLAFPFFPPLTPRADA